MVIMDNGNEVYGEKRSYIGCGGKRRECGKVRKVCYSDVVRLIKKYVRGSGSMRLRVVVKSLEEYMGVSIDRSRVKEMLGDMVMERKVIEMVRGCNGEVSEMCIVEDWVVMKGY